MVYLKDHPPELKIEPETVVSGLDRKNLLFCYLDEKLIIKENVNIVNELPRINAYFRDHNEKKLELSEAILLMKELKRDNKVFLSGSIPLNEANNIPKIPWLTVGPFLERREISSDRVLDRCKRIILGALEANNRDILNEDNLELAYQARYGFEKKLKEIIPVAISASKTHFDIAQGAKVSRGSHATVEEKKNAFEKMTSRTGVVRSTKQSSTVETVGDLINIIRDDIKIWWKLFKKIKIK